MHVSSLKKGDVCSRTRLHMDAAVNRYDLPGYI
jgi:hypothetical protein